MLDVPIVVFSIISCLEAILHPYRRHSMGNMIFKCTTTTEHGLIGHLTSLGTFVNLSVTLKRNRERGCMTFAASVLCHQMVYGLGSNVFTFEWHIFRHMAILCGISLAGATLFRYTCNFSAMERSGQRVCFLNHTPPICWPPYSI